MYRDGVLGYTTTNWKAGLRPLVSGSDGTEELIMVRAYDSTGSLWGNNGATVASVTSAPWTITYNTVGGPAYVFVHVTDRAGNTREYLGYQLDNVPPTIGDLTGFRGRVGRVSGSTQLNVPLSGGANHVEARVDGTLVDSWDGGHSPESYSTTTGVGIDYNFGTTARTATVDVLVRDVAGYTHTR